MDLTLAHSPLTLVLAALGAGALTWWSYGRTTPRVTGGLRVLLAALRWTALAVVLLLLFDPVLRRLVGRDEPGVLAVLVDVSRSLTLDPTGRGAPAERLATALSQLPRDRTVRLYPFASEAAPLAGPPDSLVWDGERTDIAGALARVERDLRGRNLRGVLLLSDGRYNAGRNPAYVAERSRVPIYVAVVGDSVSPRDVRVTGLVTNEVAYVGNALPVRATLRATGYAGTRATVSLVEGGRTLATTTVALPADGGEAVVDLAVTPAAPGLRRYAVAVEPQAGEATTRNNSESVAVRVLSYRRQLLVLAAGPGPDLGALRAVLEADRPFDVTLRTQRAPGAFYEGALPALPGPFDAVVLVGYPGRAADAATAARVAAAVRDGLPALFVLTPGTDLPALGRAFGDVLGAAPEAVRPGAVEAALAVTPAGAAHPVLSIPGVSLAATAGLPPLDASPTRWALAPDARVLATTRRDGVDTGAPLLVVRARGRQRAAALLAANSWRWRTLPEGRAALAPFYPGLVENLVRWVTTREDRRRVRVRPTRATFGETERVTFVGGVYDEALRPVENAAVEVVLVGPDGARTALPMQAVGNGRYTLDAGTRPAGSYAFEAAARRGGQPLGVDRGAFAVGPLAVEFREPGADVALLRQIALRSGGRVVPLDEIGGLRDELSREGRLAARTVEQERETPLLDWPLLLAFVVACLTAEWVLRKRAGMV